MCAQRTMQRAGRLLLAFLLPLFLAGCDECLDEGCCNGWSGDTHPPAVPVGLASITGDGEVYLEWIDVQDRDLDGYRVYVSESPDGRYESIGETGDNRFVDHGARNGHTYFYAVTAFDHCGNESELSYEPVHDTPRPEGFDLILTTSRLAESGYDFSEFHRQRPDDVGTDIYLQITSGTAWMYAATVNIGIQDVGFMKIEDFDWAPSEGWSELGRVELIAGHTYVVRTADNHYAKFSVVSLGGDRVSLDWAYQVDRGNRELSVGAPVTATNAGRQSPAASKGTEPTRTALGGKQG